MSVTTMPGRATAAPPTRSARTDLLRSEWTKLRTVRSTYWTLIAAVVVTLGLSAIICAVYAAQFTSLTAKARATFDPVSTSTSGGYLGQLAVIVLGVLVITNEYSSGMIRATFAAVPQRSSVLAAKATVFGAVTLVTMTAASFGAFFIGQALLSTEGIGVSITSPGALRAVAGGALYSATLGLFSLGLGAIIRKTAGAIAAVFGIIFVLPIIVGLLPSSMSDLQKYLPAGAGQAILSTRHNPAYPQMSPWAGFAVFCGYAAISLVAAAITIERRDV